MMRYSGKAYKTENLFPGIPCHHPLTLKGVPKPHSEALFSHLWKLRSISIPASRVNAWQQQTTAMGWWVGLLHS